MASSPSMLCLIKKLAFTLLLLSVSTEYAAAKCYTSIFAFGDSLTDTGNLMAFFTPNKSHRCFFLPYGKTYFRRPTGRCADGRLILDFFAEHFGLPFVPPYGGGKASNTNFQKGANFAVIGAAALDTAVFAQRKINLPFANDSLRIQMDAFKNMLPSICPTYPSCNKVLGGSLILLGEIGGNDYYNCFLSRLSEKEIQSTFVPQVVNTIASTISELIKLGAVTFVVPGMLPVGCFPGYLEFFKSSNSKDYDKLGCLTRLNRHAEYHNTALKGKLNQLRKLHPQATIIYADYYNAAMQLYNAPGKQGFTGPILSACCGGGGAYNFNPSVQCGDRRSTPCNNPSLYINWDGYHFTDAGYSFVAKSILGGQYAIPRFDFSCK